MKAPQAARVLIPLDGSPVAESILPVVRRLFLPEATALTLLMSATDDSTRLSEAEAYLHQSSLRLATEGYPVRIVLRRGPATAAILDAADAESSTHIALATHGRSGVNRLLLGSVAEQVLASSPVPVLIARPGETPPPHGTHRRLLVPLDHSPEALDALGPVLEMAAGMDARVTLLHIEPPTPYLDHWPPPDTTMRTADRLLRDALIPTELEQRHGLVPEQILQAAAEHQADLIVMATHGRSGPSRWVLGSATTEILRHSSVPLLAIRRGVPQKHAAGSEFSAATSPPAAP